jgi:16S rRNA (adenine1518-N6/adenine1519-N6)-dimethyltransferase
VPSIALEIPPGAFRPPPEVGSALVSLKLPGDKAKLGISDDEQFLDFVKKCFAQKRKTLVNNLRGIATPERVKAALVDSALSASARAEELSVAQLAALFTRLR